MASYQPISSTSKILRKFEWHYNPTEKDCWGSVSAITKWRASFQVERCSRDFVPNYVRAGQFRVNG